jgi:hypothetical protein
LRLHRPHGECECHGQQTGHREISVHQRFCLVVRIISWASLQNHRTSSLRRIRRS